MSDIPEEDKLEITTKIATALIAEQFPQFLHLDIRPVDHGGNDNRTFRLGSDMSIRLPSGEEYVRQVQKEQKWLPKIALHCDLPTSYFYPPNNQPERYVGREGFVS